MAAKKTTSKTASPEGQSETRRQVLKARAGSEEARPGSEKACARAKKPPGREETGR